MSDVYLNGATVMTTPTRRSLEIARAESYRGIEARTERLLEDVRELRGIADAVHPGDVWSLNGVRLSLRPNGAMDRATLEADLARRLPICQALGAAYLLSVPPRMAGLKTGDALRGTREALELTQERADRAGLRIAFEFLGFGDCPIDTPAKAAEAVDGLEQIDLVLDSCHWHASGSASLQHYPVERIAMVHLNDAPDKPPREIEDADRLLPGEGVIRLRDLIGELTGRGYGGPWSLETFNPRYWEEDPASVAARGRSALAGLLA